MRRLAILALAIWAVLPLQADYAGPTSGQKVAFLGDSITQFGEGPTGYVTLVAMALHDLGKPITVIPAGVSGNTSKDMLARLQTDVLDKKPDWMTLSCGVNDVWHGAAGVDLETYKKNITFICDQAAAAGIKIVILTSTMIEEDQTKPNNQKLVAYNDFLRGFAAQRHYLLADLGADMQTEVQQYRAHDPGFVGNFLTVDGVHMNGLGNVMMAEGILRGLGLSDAQIAPEKAKWIDLPGAVAQPGRSLTVRQYLMLLDAPSKP
jgi:lysophospholipase L1-like esterase